jgi:hypothetical protein
LKEVGKTSIESERLISWAIGTKRALMQDFSNPAGITSSVQEESVDEKCKITFFERRKFKI